MIANESPKYIIDSFAWIEYLRGTHGLDSEFKTIIELGSIEGKVYTPTIVLAEIKRAYLRRNLKGFEEDLEVIKSYSELIENIDEGTAILAGSLRQKLGPFVKSGKNQIGLIDCFLLALAKNLNAKLITGEEHFERIAFAEKYKIVDKVGELKDYVEFIKPGSGRKVA